VLQQRRRTTRRIPSPPSLPCLFPPAPVRCSPPTPPCRWPCSPRAGVTITTSSSSSLSRSIPWPSTLRSSCWRRSCTRRLGLPLRVEPGEQGRKACRLQGVTSPPRRSPCGNTRRSSVWLESSPQEKHGSSRKRGTSVTCNKPSFAPRSAAWPRGATSPRRPPPSTRRSRRSWPSHRRCARPRRHSLHQHRRRRRRRRGRRWAWTTLLLLLLRRAGARERALHLLEARERLQRLLQPRRAAAAAPSRTAVVQANIIIARTLCPARGGRC